MWQSNYLACSLSVSVTVKLPGLLSVSVTVKLPGLLSVCKCDSQTAWLTLCLWVWESNCLVYSLCVSVTNCLAYSLSVRVWMSVRLPWWKASSVTVKLPSLSVCLSVSVCSLFCPFFYPEGKLGVWANRLVYSLSLCLFLCVSFCLSVCLSVSLFVCLCVWDSLRHNPPGCLQVPARLWGSVILPGLQCHARLFSEDVSQTQPTVWRFSLSETAGRISGKSQLLLFIFNEVFTETTPLFCQDWEVSERWIFTQVLRNWRDEVEHV